MSVYQGKKVETVTVKVNQQQLIDFKEICEKLDRPMSYVVRELALRGLVQYKQDGQLKLTAEEENFLSSLSNKNIEGKELATKSKKKIPFNPSGAEEKKNAA